MTTSPGNLHVDQLAAHPEWLEQVGILRWNQWATAWKAKDPAPFIDISRKEAGDGVSLPMTFVAIDDAQTAVGVVGLGPIDDEVSRAERAGRTPWILGMVVAKDARMRGVGRLLLDRLQDAAASLGHTRTWVATGEQATGFYQRCGWEPVEYLRLESTGVPTTILCKPTVTPNAVRR